MIRIIWVDDSGRFFLENEKIMIGGIP